NVGESRHRLGPRGQRRERQDGGGEGHQFAHVKSSPTRTNVLALALWQSYASAINGEGKHSEWPRRGRIFCRRTMRPVRFSAVPSRPKARASLASVKAAGST